MTPDIDPVVHWDAMERFIRSTLVANGTPNEAAAVVASVLVRTEARGVTSHGLRLLPGYLRQLESGGVRPDAEFRVLNNTSLSAVVDGGSNFGMAIAQRAIDVAIQKASQAGMAFVVVRASNHLGASGHYALRCAEAGLMSLVFTNAPPVMKVTGSRGAVIGNNPIAYGVPWPAEFPIVFDAALSVAAGGRVRRAAEMGEVVPDGWFVDAEGEPSTNPNDYLQGGSLMPLGDHKGYGLAFFVECLAGVLSGAALAGEIGNWAKDPATPTNTGHAFLVVRPELLIDSQSFAARVSRLAELIRSAPRASGVDEILLPGELEHRRESRARAEGIQVAAATWDALAGVAIGLASHDALSNTLVTR